MLNLLGFSLPEGAVHMLIEIVVTALVGALATSIVLWPLGMLIALAAAPFGGSLLALVVAVWVSQAAEPRSERTQSQSQNRPIIQ
jgi:hypothetical protein